MKTKIIIAVIAMIVIIFFVYFASNNIDSLASYSCNADSDCKKVTIDCCNNNAPTQNTCVSKSDLGIWKSFLQINCGGIMCLQYLVPGNYSCACRESRCWTYFTNQVGNVEGYTGLQRGK